MTLRRQLTIISYLLLPLATVCFAPSAPVALVQTSRGRATTRSSTRQLHSTTLPFVQHAIPPSLTQVFDGIRQPVQTFLEANQGGHAVAWLEVLANLLLVGGGAAAQSSNLPSMGLAAQIQSTGEASLAALLVVAALQGANIMKQYSSNPLGELVVPPGLTVGVEDASLQDSPPTPVVTNDRSNSAAAPLAPKLSSQQLEDLLCGPHDTQLSCEAKKGWYHVNRFLVLLLPFLASQGWGLALRFGHLLHMCTILGLAKVYDMFKALPDLAGDDDDAIISNKDDAFSDEPHVVVIGDSMSVGIGCSTEFDPDKNSGILYRIEQLEPSEGVDPEEAVGPVFPRALARTLSHRLGKPVSWRSGGVDGGDTKDIQQHLLPIIQEEVDRGRPPDVVVVLTGSNDLKHILSTDPEHAASVRGFRSHLLELVRNIRAISPRTRVVFPALPTYRLDRNSILNVFPLSFFLDAIIGIWDAQKIQAAKSSPHAVRYVDLTVEDMNAWYSELQRGSSGEPATLIAPDGIHPNAQCYAKWAQYVGNHLADTLAVERGAEEEENKESPETAAAHATIKRNLSKANNNISAWGVVPKFIINNAQI